MSFARNVELNGANYVQFAGTRTFGSLDGLRAIAILAVVWHHTAVVIPGWRITSRGFLGVDLFFIISGFLIVTLLLRERRRTGTLSLRNFYIRRFLRIFPAYYLTLLVVGTVAFLKPGGTESPLVRRDLPFAAFFVSNLTPMLSLLSVTWSLSAEEQFYLLAPAVEKYAGRMMRFLLPLAYLLVSLPPLGLFPSLHLPHFFREATFGPILLGVMLAHVLDDPRGFSWVSRVVGGRLGPPIALFLIDVLASWPVDDISGWPRIGVHWAMVALVASCVVREDNLLAPTLRLWPMRRIGIVSYGIYLYHLSVMHFVLGGLNKAGVRWPFVAFLGTALATWIVAELSYRLLEARFLALKARFTQPGLRPREDTPR